MDTLIVYPENKEQLTAIKAVMKAMNIAFEEKEEAYPENVIKGVTKSLEEAKNANLKDYKGIRDMLGL